MTHPSSWDRLLPHQQRAVRWLAGRDAGLLALSPGLGKSAVALLAMQVRDFKEVTIVCPLTLMATWEQEIHKWWPEAVVWQRDEEPNPLRVHWPPIIAIVTYDYLRKYGLPRGKTDSLLFDESVLLKNRKAARSIAARKYRREAGVCWMLSGSPTTRFHDDLWHQLSILDRKSWPSYWRFAHTYCLSEKTIWGESIVANVPHAEQRLQQDAKDLLYTYSYADLARDNPQAAIPEWIFEHQDVPLPAAWWKLYRSMQTKFLAELEDGQKITAANGLVRLLRLLQMATNPALAADEPIAGAFQGKCKAAIELLDALPQPTIIWTAFKRTAQALAGEVQTAILDGDTPVALRARIVTDFQDSKIPVLVAHPGVGRFGLTLTRARSAIYCERSYDGDSWYQSLHRFRRIGTTEPPQVVLLRATGPDGQHTVDHVIDRVLNYRKEAALKLTANLVQRVLQ